MTRDTTHGTKGSMIVRAMVAAVLVASLFGLSTLAATAQEEPPGFEVPTPLEFCQEQYPDGIVDTGPIVEEALAGVDLPPEIADEILSSFSFTVTCEDVFGGEAM